MSELPSKDVYKFINGYDNHQDFVEFARNSLNLKNREINDILSDYSGNREQKYQMVCYWKRKVGREGTTAKLYELKELNRVAGNENDNENRVEPAPEDAEPPQCLQGRVDERTFNDPNYAKPMNTATMKVAPMSANTSASNPALPEASTATRLQNLQLHSEADYCADITNLEVRNCTDKEIIAILTKGGSYPMTKIPKGCIVIFNNTPASHLGTGKKDAENMTMLWKQLDCKVLEKKELSANEIRETLEKMKTSKQVLSFDYLGILLFGKSEMSSGREAVIASDNEPVFLDEITEQFNDDNFSAFAGKPKLFFCHLLTPEEGVEVKVFQDQLMVISRAMCFTLTSNSGNSGSWFVNTITNVFARFSHNEPIQQLLQRIGSAFDFKVASLGDGESNCSIPAIAIHSKLKLMYLLPGHPKDDLFD